MKSIIFLIYTDQTLWRGNQLQCEVEQIEASSSWDKRLCGAHVFVRRCEKNILNWLSDFFILFWRSGNLLNLLFEFSIWITCLWNWNTSRTCYRQAIILCTSLVMQLVLTWIKIIIPIHIFNSIGRGKTVLFQRGFNYIISFWYSKLSLVLIQNKS